VNKWDLVTKDNNSAARMEKEIKNKTAPFTDYPVLFISAINKQRIHKILETVDMVDTNRKRKIPTPMLNDVLLNIINENPPPALKGKYIRIKYVTQLPVYNPSFAFFCNFPQYIREPYKRYIENRMREKFNFTGVPVRLFFRKK
jgi:GTP-binding protein